MTRLVRVRQKQLPDGVRAFAWPLSNGNVIVYASTDLSLTERASAVRLALRETRQPSYKTLAAVPLMYLAAPESGKLRTVAASATSAVVTAAVAAGIFFAMSGGTEPARLPPAASGPMFPLPAPTQQHQTCCHRDVGPGGPPSMPGSPGPTVSTITHHGPRGHHPKPSPSTSSMPTPGPSGHQSPSPTPTWTAPSPSPTTTGPARTPTPRPSPTPTRSHSPSDCLIWVRILGIRLCV